MNNFSAMRARKAIAENIKESGRNGLQNRVRSLVLSSEPLYGRTLFYHTWSAKKSAPGFPDCVIVQVDRGRVIFAELKSEFGKVSAAQEDWLQALAGAGNEVYLWRPSHLVAGKIGEVLQSRGGVDHGRIWPDGRE